MDNITDLIDDIFAAGPTGVILRIVIILVMAFVAQWIGGRAIRRSVLAVASRAPKRRAGQLRGADDDELATTLMEDRQGQRAHALGSLAKNALTITIWVIAVMMILSTLGVNIALAARPARAGSQSPPAQIALSRAAARAGARGEHDTCHGVVLIGMRPIVRGLKQQPHCALVPMPRGEQ